MTTRVNIEHIFNCSEDTFWEKLFFTEEYNRRLFLEALRFPSFNLATSEDRGDTIFRVVEVVPRLPDLPTAIKKVVGDNVAYREEGTFDKKTRRYKIRVVPSRLADKLSIAGELYTEPYGDNGCKRRFTAEVSASIFGIGGLLEKRIAEDLEKSYEVGARFTNSYVAEKGF
ncbi:MAG TPA: DUF2505 family protein [Polyangiaceae bacterium]